jgi:hypothetical protein
MIGKAGGRRFTCGCCDWSKGKRGVKADEERRVFREAEEEMFEDIEKHARGICFNPKTKLYGCVECYDDLEPYDNSDLDDIERVWCNVDWRTD